MRETCVDLRSQGNYTLFRETINECGGDGTTCSKHKEKLSGNNFNDWFARLKLVLRVEKKMHVIEQPLPPAPKPDSEPNVVAEWTALYDAHTEIACLMLGSMTSELHRQFELYYPYDMIRELRSMFEKQARVEKFDLIQSFHACKQEEGKPVADYILKMKGICIALNFLVIAIHTDFLDGKIQKANKKSLKAKGKNKVKGKGKDKQVYIPKPKNPKPTTMERPAKDDACHHYKEVGHWKRNCPVYLAELIKKKKQVGSASSSAYHPYTPQHNGVSERRNRTLLDMVRSMMNLTTLPLSFWDYALESATRILNMVPTKKVDKTPYELWYGKVPNLSYLKVWGCEALVKRDTPDKLKQRSVKCIFIGYPKETMGYYFYFPPENKIVVARYAEFFENVEGFEPPQEEVIPIRRSERTHRAPNRLCLNVEVEEHSLGDLGEPANYKAAMLDPESKRWVDAMNAEMQSMIDNMVWVLVDLPPNCKTVGSKWIFKKKTDMDGNVHIYKARLVAKGYTQTFLVDYEETFSPVADIRAIRILISIAAFYDYEIWQMDVKTAFLNGYLDEDIYMVQPEGFVDPKHPRKDLGEAAFILGIKIYRDRSKRLIGHSQNAYMDKILKRYKMDNSKRGTIPMQEKLDLNKSQGAQTPKEVNRMKNIPYVSAVGSIMYAVRCTRPDVAFAQNLTSRFQQNPGELHWTAVKNILKYLRNTKDMFLVYGGNPSTKLRVECYCDAGFETDRDDTKSQTGYVFVLNRGAVDWKSSKQSTIVMSAIESEYIAASKAAMEAVWIRKFISGLGIIPTINEPMKVYCDNSAAVHFANEPGVQRGARHYHRRYHYVRECVELGEIRILKVHTDNNLADPFTKALSNRKLTQHARSMGLRPASSFM
ncbi:retrotransposon protein, putative, ty1-copia subclass [Tanacetum coccineum]